jgi:hypothetical protein
MNRRDFIKSTIVGSAALALPAVSAREMPWFIGGAPSRPTDLTEKALEEALAALYEFDGLWNDVVGRRSPSECPA